MKKQRLYPLVTLWVALHISVSVQAQPVTDSLGAAVPSEDGVDLDNMPGSHAKLRKPRIRSDGNLSRISLEARISGVLDNDNRDDDDELSGKGIAAGGTAAWQNHRRAPSLQAQYSLDRYESSSESRPDRTAQRLTVAAIARLASRWTLQATAAAYANASTTEYRSADQLQLTPRLLFRPNAGNRLRLTASYRHRWYDDEAGTDARSPFAVLDYQRRWASGHAADAGVRAEWNRAELLGRDYNRMLVFSAYTYPVAARDRLRMELRHRNDRYLSRPVAFGLANRRDRRTTAQVTFMHELTNAARADLSYRFLTRRSNDPRRQYDSHRAVLTLLYAWP